LLPEFVITPDPLHPDLPPALVDHLADVRQQLDAFATKLLSRNPSIYRDLALYLQVLREGLLNAVQQACFHLATHFYPERYCQLDAGQRSALHGRIAELVQRCCSLLTVEHVVQLAGQIGLERRQQQQRRQQEWLAQLRKAGDDLSAEVGLADGGSDGDGDRASTAGGDPDGSIRLNAALPVDLQRWQGLIRSAAGAPDPQHAEDTNDGEEPDSGEPDDILEGLLGPEAHALLDSLIDGGSEEGLPPPWDSPALPTDPQALQEWLGGFERALVRRLRNLSHALNVELLRSGLSRSLLPTSLLQAALQGQLEPQPAPANLLRLQVPLGEEAGGEFDSVALLLRLSDLELDQPRLRTCRGRWQRHRQEVRRMAEQHRRLQRQLQRLEAERLWHQDNPSQPPQPNPGQAPMKPG
jgi:hypothetical protein